MIVSSIAMPVAEICDKLTILMLKLDRLPADTVEKDQLRAAVRYYESGIDKSNVQLTNLLHKLAWCNEKIWDLEHEIRKGMDNELGFAEIGRRAVAVRDMNRLRIRYKNQICELVNQPEFIDCKMNHCSQ